MGSGAWIYVYTGYLNTANLPSSLLDLDVLASPLSHVQIETNVCLET